MGEELTVIHDKQPMFCRLSWSAAENQPSLCGHTVTPPVRVLYDVGKVVEELLQFGKARLQSMLAFIFKVTSLKTFGRPNFIGYLRQMEDTRSDCPWTPLVYDLRQCAHYAFRFRK